MDAATALRTQHVLRRFLDDSLAANDVAGIAFTGEALRACIESDVSVYVVDSRGLNAYERTRAEHANPNSRYEAGGYAEARNSEAARAAFGAFRAESFARTAPITGSATTRRTPAPTASFAGTGSPSHGKTSA